MYICMYNSFAYVRTEPNRKLSFDRSEAVGVSGLAVHNIKYKPNDSHEKWSSLNDQQQASGSNRIQWIRGLVYGSSNGEFPCLKNTSYLLRVRQPPTDKRKASSYTSSRGSHIEAGRVTCVCEITHVECQQNSVVFREYTEERRIESSK